LWWEVIAVYFLALQWRCILRYINEAVPDASPSPGEASEGNSVDTIERLLATCFALASQFVSLYVVFVFCANSSYDTPHFLLLLLLLYFLYTDVFVFDIDAGLTARKRTIL
jgi:hypothetical protein